jgi:tetratricopeptide (TPR) repeat protein
VAAPDLARADYAAHYAPAAEPETAPAEAAAAEELDRLRALGYLGGGAAGGTAVEGTMSAPALANEALLLQQEGRLEEALRALRASLRLAPQRAATRTNLAILLTEMGRGGDALRALEGLVEEQPESPQARLNLARALSLAGRWDEAVAQYDALLRLHPEEPSIPLYRATALRRAGRPREAAAAFREIVERRPGEVVPRVEEAMALAAAGDHRGALARLDAGLAALPRSGELVHAQARLLALAPPPVGDPQRALALAEAIHQARPEPAHAETLAMALAANGRFEEAAALQRRLLAGAADEETRARLRADLERYQAGRPAAASG